VFRESVGSCILDWFVTFYTSLHGGQGGFKLFCRETVNENQLKRRGLFRLLSTSENKETFSFRVLLFAAGV